MKAIADRNYEIKLVLQHCGRFGVILMILPSSCLRFFDFVVYLALIRDVCAGFEVLEWLCSRSVVYQRHSGLLMCVFSTWNSYGIVVYTFWTLCSSSKSLKSSWTLHSSLAALNHVMGAISFVYLDIQGRSLVVMDQTSLNGPICVEQLVFSLMHFRPYCKVELERERLSLTSW